MSDGKKKASQFLAALEASETPPPPPARASPPKASAGAPRAPAGRDGKKHIGGYFDRPTVEKVAILRARLGKDNSELLELAIDDLFRKHEAQRSFGDA